jgi:hypothetical protein
VKGEEKKEKRKRKEKKEDRKPTLCITIRKNGVRIVNYHHHISSQLPSHGNRK